ncbi:hypothetical protein Pmani_001785 [Petrolisthes manimaculis]|uniref:Endonuclease/exonuclease/phosphatase domain-containing protein n=1 Tax=Petrolisthes manimaculis TaxID=1843537 RepID=A0AAE1PNB3_9EUCA|nr:hypothetical protein Pmani_017214 [Petrolisthes manimaculis]KAK4311533.1 hypothetical protein Pmani_016967 [Petrolisthes manimaculis]KAK4324102.1 hypothetical protein Pmani_005246 [Petrolisthes manimaculis]KAK4327743.1 hypothetical protein Pmani_001785 [Petrolisthes manimaculis]
MRGEARGNTLDLLFSNDETIIEEVYIDSPLGSSDHASIFFRVDVKELEEKSKREIYLYEKADYPKMRRLLDVDLEQIMSQSLSTDEKWKVLRDKLSSIIEECVPKRIMDRRKKRKRTNEDLPMNRKLWTKIKRKQRLWERAKELRRNDSDPRIIRKIEEEYRRTNNQVRRQTRNAVKAKEREIAKHVKENPKIFWKYVPEDWRIANITAIFKKVNKCDPGNYRPVSLTSIFCKIMESLLREEIIYHMKDNKLLRIEKTETEKDIVVVIDNKLKFSDHLAEKINKANKIVGLI